MESVTGPEYPEYRWFIILTEPGREAKALSGLFVHRFDAFGPSVYKQQVVRKGGRDLKDEKGRKVYKKVERPMFPGYIFAKFARGLERFEAARRVPGVREFLKIEGAPATLPGALVEAIRAEESKQLSAFEESIKPRGALSIPFVKGGDAKIDSGPYADWIGKMLRKSKSGDRITLLLSMFGGDTKVEIDASQIRAA